MDKSESHRINVLLNLIMTTPHLSNPFKINLDVQSQKEETYLLRTLKHINILNLLRNHLVNTFGLISGQRANQ